MLTHQFSMHQHLIFHTIQTIHFKQIDRDNFGPTRNLGLFLIVPKNSVWVVHGQPPHQPQFHFFKTEIRGHFRPHNTQNHNLTHKYNTSHTNSLWTIQNGSQIFSKQSQIFGTDQTASYDLIQSKSLTRLLNKD